MRRLYAITVDIFEPSRPFPIVQHRFLGLTREEAEGYHEAHRKSDRFLRECEDKEAFSPQPTAVSTVKCRAVVRHEWIRSAR